MFAGNRGGLNFTLKEGQDVIVLGSVSVYEKVDHIRYMQNR